MRVKTGNIRGRVQTVERTSKRFKAAMVIARVLVVLAPFVVLAGGMVDPGYSWAFLVPGGLMFVAAVVLALYSKIGAWWHND